MTPEDIAADLQDACRLEFSTNELGVLVHVCLAKPGTVTVYWIRKATGVRWETAQAVLSKVTLFELRCKVNVKPNPAVPPKIDNSCHVIPCPFEQ